MTRRTTLLALTAATLTATALGGSASAAPSGDHSGSSDDRGARQVRLVADLDPLNGSGASGEASARVRGTTVERISLDVEGLTPDGPHAVHIHYGDDARNECPTAADAGADGFVSAADGVPAYGPIVLSLTTSGDTTPGSALDLARMPVAEDGELDYKRRNLPFTDVAGTGYGPDGGTAEQIAASVRDGEGVLVVHGVDYDRSGGYTLGDRGETELLPAGNGVPAEATDVAACGVLEVVERGHGHGEQHPHARR